MMLQVDLDSNFGIVSAPVRAVQFTQGQQAIFALQSPELGPLAVVDSYWAAIDAHEFATAFAYEAPGVNGSEVSFVNSHEMEGITSVSFTGRVSALSATSATVGVVSLTTRDNEYGCRDWSGYYSMVDRSSGWLISRANVKATQVPC
jgi:hypothetical protein